MTPGRLEVLTPLLHVDMDAFYASVATRGRPDLQGVPVVVGGGYRGVVLAANYHARAFGVRSGMPSTRSRRLCPQAVVLRPDFAEVSAVSTAVMEAFRRITPVMEVPSPDEAYLDVRGAVRRLGPPVEIAEQLRSTIHDEQGITCSVGVAASVSVAKLASRRAKPDGVVVVAPDDVVAFLHPLDVGELHGVGETTRRALGRAGLHTVGDLAHVPMDTLRAAMGPGPAAMLRRLAWGDDRRELGTDRGPGQPDRSMGAQETFGRDVAERDVVLRELLRLTEKVARRLRAAEVVGRTVTLTVRFADFRTITRSRTLSDPTDVTQEIYACAVASYDALGLRRQPLRLVGVRVEQLVPRGSVQRQLRLGDREHGWADADRAVDLAARRFGGRVVRPATLIDRDASRAAT